MRLGVSNANRSSEAIYLAWLESDDGLRAVFYYTCCLERDGNQAMSP
jgi:hypothetical protein